MDVTWCDACLGLVSKVGFILQKTECTGSQVLVFFLAKLTSQPDAYLLGEKWLLVLAKFSLTHMPFIVG